MNSYPSTARTWLVFRSKWCAEMRRQRSSTRRKRLEKWLVEMSTRKLKLSLLRKYSNALHGGLFYAAPSIVQGTGVFAATNLAPGDYPELFGECRQISLSRQGALERRGEHSFWLGHNNRVEYFGGPLSLVNHACPPANNAEFIVHYPSPGHKQVCIKILKRLAPGEEIFVDYGRKWWVNREKEGIICQCTKCSHQK